MTDLLCPMSEPAVERQIGGMFGFLDEILDHPSYERPSADLWKMFKNSHSMTAGVIPLIGPSGVGKTTLLNDIVDRISANKPNRLPALKIDACETGHELASAILTELTGRQIARSAMALAKARLIEEIKAAPPAALVVDHLERVEPRHIGEVCGLLQAVRERGSTVVIAGVDQTYWSRYCHSTPTITWLMSIRMNELAGGDETKAKLLLEAILSRVLGRAAALHDTPAAASLLKASQCRIGHIMTILRLALETALLEEEPSTGLLEHHLQHATEEFMIRSHPTREPKAQPRNRNYPKKGRRDFFI